MDENYRYILLNHYNNSPADIPHSKITVIIQATEKLGHYVIHIIFLTWTCTLLYISI